MDLAALQRRLCSFLTAWSGSTGLKSSRIILASSTKERAEVMSSFMLKVDTSMALELDSETEPCQMPSCARETFSSAVPWRGLSAGHQFWPAQLLGPRLAGHPDPRYSSW